MKPRVGRHPSGSLRASYSILPIGSLLFSCYFLLSGTCHHGNGNLLVALYLTVTGRW